jgi:hypothetical protein
MMAVDRLRIVTLRALGVVGGAVLLTVWLNHALPQPLPAAFTAALLVAFFGLLCFCLVLVFFRPARDLRVDDLERDDNAVESRLAQNRPETLICRLGGHDPTMSLGTEADDFERIVRCSRCGDRVGD